MIVALGCIDKLKKALLQELELEIVSPDAPLLVYFEQDDMDCVDIELDVADSDQWKRTWWHRCGNTYWHMEDSISMLDQL